MASSCSTFSFCACSADPWYDQHVAALFHTYLATVVGKAVFLALSLNGIVGLMRLYLQRPLEIPRRIVFWVSLIIVFFAGFEAWREEHNAVIDLTSFELTIPRWPEFFDDHSGRFGKTRFVDVYLLATILNRGSPSSVRNFRLRVTSTPLPPEFAFDKLGPADIPPDLGVGTPDEERIRKLKIAPRNALDARTMKPIAHNERVTGWLRFAGFTGAAADKLREGAVFELSAEDALGKQPPAHATVDIPNGLRGVCVPVDKVSEHAIMSDVYTEGLE
jgi:hypothetical protein